MPDEPRPRVVREVERRALVFLEPALRAAGLRAGLAAPAAAVLARLDVERGAAAFLARLEVERAAGAFLAREPDAPFFAPVERPVLALRAPLDRVDAPELAAAPAAEALSVHLPDITR